VANESPELEGAHRRLVVPLLGAAQILSWGTSFHLLAVFAAPIARDTGWPLALVVAGGSIGLLCSGLAAPFVGKVIQRHGGRPTMAAGSVLIGLGLVAISLSSGPLAYLSGWALLGLGMSASLYEAAFSTLGRIFGASARRAITNLTLIGGFASTICWPLSALAIERLGWRDACLIYAAANVALAAPALFMLLPRERPASPVVRPAARGAVAPAEGRAFYLLAAVLMLNGAIQTSLSIHLLTMLQDQGMALAAAVAVGALIGPVQVGARLAEILLGDRLHPTSTLAVAAGLTACGTALLAIGAPPALAIIVHASGAGLWSIARGTAPLALFGPERYPLVVGKLAMPTLIVQAIAPFGAGLLLTAAGADATLALLAVGALLNGLMALALARGI
jgi:MFS family permease